MPMLRAYTCFLLLLSFSAHSQSSVTVMDSSCAPCRQKDARVLDEALTYMKQHYYKREYIQWDDLAARARTRLSASNGCGDAKDAISWCFEQLNEPHSFLMTADKSAKYNNDPDLLIAPPDLSELVGEIKGDWLGDSIAYLTIPWISTTDSMICMQLADSIQNIIARLDKRNISRWIIDLRKNTGGNCWPMLAGLGPLLGNGVCGYFVGDESRVAISYKDGAACQGRHVLCRVSNNGYRTRSDRNYVVVLTGRRTVSAGEIVAMAFKGKDQAVLLGEPTAGLTTANATYSLSDHSTLVLSICREADHTGRVWAGSVQPDKLVIAATNTSKAPTNGFSMDAGDPVVTAAIDWLRSTPVLAQTPH